MKRMILIALSLVLLVPAWGQMKRSYKRGVGENSFTRPVEITSLAKGVSWTYNWGPNPASRVASQLHPGGEMEFVPQVWNGNFDEQAIRDSLTKYPGTKYLLGFNEPNFKAQANMTPTQAAEKWPILEGIARDYNLKLVSPALNYPDGAINDGNTYQPIDWLTQFIAAYKNLYGREPQMDYVALHCYMNSYTAMHGFVDNFAQKFGKKVWLTEFCSWEGTVDSLTQLNTMVQKVQALELDTLVDRYAWFKAKGSNAAPYYRLLETPNLMTHLPPYGTLTTMGLVYVNMSTFDTTYYHQANTLIAAKDYVNSQGISLERNSDAESTVPIQIGTFDTGCWTEYLLDVPSAGDYIFTFRLASEKFLMDPKIRININGTTVGEKVLPSTGSVDKWATQQVEATLPAGKVKVRIVSGQSTTCKVNWLKFAPKGGLKGDVNGDGMVNVADVTELVNMLTAVKPTDASVADIDGDGMVNVKDVTELVNLISK